MTAAPRILVTAGTGATGSRVARLLREAGVDDVAAAAAGALLTDEATDSDHLLAGPEPLSHAQVAGIISAVARRPVRYVPITHAEQARRLTDAGIPPAFAQTLVDADALVREGGEDRVTTEVLELACRPPMTFARFAQKHRAEWD